MSRPYSAFAVYSILGLLATLAAMPLARGESPPIPEHYSHGWRSIASSAERTAYGVRVAYQPLSGAPPSSAPSTSAPLGGSGTVITAPGVSAPVAPAMPSSVPLSSSVPRQVVSASGTCGSELPSAVAPLPQSRVGWPPLLPIVPMPPTVHVTRGVLGQPVLYVPGQPIRNFLRYFGP